MATLAYPYSVRDSANTSTDNRKTGLTPTVSNGHTLAASPASVLASTVTVVEVGSGDYVALYDAETNGDASFPIDWGSSLTNPNDRYATLILTREPGRIITALPNSTIPAAILAATVPVRNQDAVTAPIVSDCLQGAWGEPFAKRHITGTADVMQLPDNSAPARTFALDSATVPTSRS